MQMHQSRVNLRQIDSAEIKTKENISFPPTKSGLKSHRSIGGRRRCCFKRSTRASSVNLLRYWQSMAFIFSSDRAGGGGERSMERAQAFRNNAKQ